MTAAKKSVELMSISEVAATYFGCTPQRVYQMVDEGKLPAVTIGEGKRKWIPRRWLEERITEAIAAVAPELTREKVERITDFIVSEGILKKCGVSGATEGAGAVDANSSM